MSEDLIIGAVSLAIAAGLISIGWPRRGGENPRFLRFEAALVLYPPLVMVFLALGFAELLAGLMR